MTTKNLSRYLIGTVISILLISCSNPASDDDHDEHTEPYGLELVMNGETILEYFDGDINGQLSVNEGEETSLITLRFLNEVREEIHEDDLDEEYSLAWEIADDQILAIEQHDEDGKWGFHIHGKSEGTSNIQLRLMHGDHADFETPDVASDEAIEVQVVASAA